GDAVGVVCHEHMGTRRVWTEEEQEFAASIADMVALVLEAADRRDAETALRAAQQELEARVERRTAELARANEALQAEVADRKRAEEELRLQKTLLEAQGEASIDGVLVVAPDGRILSYNRRFGEMWGIPADIVERGSDDDAIRTIIDNLADPEAFVARVKALYAQPEVEARDEIRLKDG